MSDSSSSSGDDAPPRFAHDDIGDGEDFFDDPPARRPVATKPTPKVGRKGPTQAPAAPVPQDDQLAAAMQAECERLNAVTSALVAAAGGDEAVAALRGSSAPCESAYDGDSGTSAALDERAVAELPTYGAPPGGDDDLDDTAS